MKKGTFTSVWDGGFEVTTNAELNEETGEVIAESVDVDDLDLEFLEREYFTDEDGKGYQVCSECHNYIMTIEDDSLICSDPNCESNE